MGLLTRAADMDGDGVVSLSDFRAMMNPPEAEEGKTSTNQDEGDDEGSTSASAAGGGSEAPTTA